MLKVFSQRGIEPLMLIETTRPLVTRSSASASGFTHRAARELEQVVLARRRRCREQSRSRRRRAGIRNLPGHGESKLEGEQGTALLSDSRDAVFVRCLLHNLAARGDASVALLRSTARPSPRRCDVLRVDGLYLEDRLRCEVQQIFAGDAAVDRVTEGLFAGPDIQAINSCAADDSFMGQLWPAAATWSTCSSIFGRASRWPIGSKLAGCSATNACKRCAIGSGAGFPRRAQSLH